MCDKMPTISVYAYLPGGTRALGELVALQPVATPHARTYPVSSHKSFGGFNA